MSEKLTDPTEDALFAKGLCSWVVEYGTVLGRIVHCQEPTVDPETKRVTVHSLYCEEHASDWITDYA